MVEVDDEVPLVAGGLNYRAPVYALALASGSGSGNTVDTGEPYRVILLSDGTVKAIPAAAVPPAPPTGITVVVALTAVNIRWSAVPGAIRYYIYRDEVLLDSTGYLNFRDTTVVVGNTYEYRVSSIDQYSQVSLRSDPVSATVSLSLNHAPVDVEIRCWPTPLPTDGPAFVRVNAWEIDIQNISYILNVDAGSLRATDDPSLWILTI